MQAVFSLLIWMLAPNKLKDSLVYLSNITSKIQSDVANIRNSYVVPTDYWPEKFRIFIIIS